MDAMFFIALGAIAPLLILVLCRIVINVMDLFDGDNADAH